mgnify:FL=1
MSILLQNINYQFPNGEVLFSNLSFSLQSGEKVALIGNNGTGKSTLLHLIAGKLSLQEGTITKNSQPYVVPQEMKPYLSLTIAQALGVDKKIEALHKILEGSVKPEHFETIGEDWEIETKAVEALKRWELPYRLEHPLSELSGGECVKVFLSGLTLYNPQLVLLDEPTNHLDSPSKAMLYDWLETTKATVLLTSHDRSLLDYLSGIYELSSLGISYYPGNYASYKEQKEVELRSIEAALKEKEKERKMAIKKDQKVAERRQKLDSRGRDLGIKKGIGKMGLDTRQDRAEKTTARYRSTHGEKITSLSKEIQSIKEQVAKESVLKLHLESSQLHENKILIQAVALNQGYQEKQLLWKEGLNFTLRSGDRVLLTGLNGSGKTTLLELILGSLKPTRGSLTVAAMNILYLDQNYSLLNPQKTVYQQAQEFNTKMPEHEVKCMLHRSQLPEEFWDNPCSLLSGGEKMKLSLCSLLISSVAPDLLILDEPTNNIDLHSINILTETVANYRGTLLLVSHDETFIKEVGVNSEIKLQR